MATLASSTASVTATTRHSGFFWISLSSRCARIQFSNVQLDKKVRVRLVWMYCYDPESAHPNWKELKGAQAEAEVGDKGTLNFLLVFGPSDDRRAKYLSRLLLTRPDPGTIADSSGDAAGVSPNSPRLPTLCYILQVAGDEGLGMKLNGRLTLKALWGEVIFAEAIDVFNRNTGPAEEFMDTRAIGKILEATWNKMFAYHRQSEYEREKRFGKKTVDDQSDQCLDEQMQAEIPTLSQEIIERIILIATESDPAPAMISRRAFCGKSPTEGISIWRVFQTVLELVGRSLFLRKLFQHRQLYLLSAQESIEIHTDKLAELGQGLVYFFRVPRSIVNEPALVIELFEVEHSHSATHLKPVRPTPYVTTSQLERAKGNPFVAFANLESVHKEKLKALHPRGLLQPPNIRMRARTADGYPPCSFAFEPDTKDTPCFDCQWWSASEIHLF